MEQIAVSFTKEWSPALGLHPTVTIMDRGGNMYVEWWPLFEMGYGWYIYNFDRYSADKVYLYTFDWGAELDDYDRYKFGGNEYDAYTNKYSWGRTAAPYFTSMNTRFNNVDKAIKQAVKSRKEYNDTALRKDIREIKKLVDSQQSSDLAEKIIELRKLIEWVNKSIKKESTSKWVNDVNNKLDLLAEYMVKSKEDMDTGLWIVGNTVMQWIQESNADLNEAVSKTLTPEELLNQVKVITDKMNEVLDIFVSTHMNWILPQELADKYFVNLDKRLSDDEIMAAFGWLNEWLNEWVSEWLNEWMSEWIEEWMSEWLNEWIEAEREAVSNAPVDMQWIAEPVMPNWI